MSTQSTTMDHPLFDIPGAPKTTTTQPQTKSRNEVLLQVGDLPFDANLFIDIQTMENEPTKRPTKRQDDPKHIKSTKELHVDESIKRPLKRQDDPTHIKSMTELRKDESIKRPLKRQDDQKRMKPKKELHEPIKRPLKRPDDQKHVKSKKPKKELHVVICIHCDCHNISVKNVKDCQL